MNKVDILSFSLQDIQHVMAAVGEPTFRAKQIFAWLHAKKATSFFDMSDLPKSLVARLDNDYEICAVKIAAQQTSADGTAKYLFEYADGSRIETVLMHGKSGSSLCISTQVGCKMGCTFCASTKNGLVRNLTAAEMLVQIYEVERQTGTNIHSLVLMGIGEPLDNFENVAQFLALVEQKDGRNLSHRNITLSTCGIVPAIEKLAQLNLNITLSVSLHAPFDDMRSEMVPVNKVYNLAALISACEAYRRETSRRVSFEYTVVPGVNNSAACAKQLAILLKNLDAHINVIALNSINSQSEVETNRAAAYAFKAMLDELSLNATVRRSLGADIDAACGQLRLKNNF